MDWVYLPFELEIMSGFFSSPAVEDSFTTSTRYSVLVVFNAGLCLESVRNLRAKTIPNATTSSPHTIPTHTPKIGVSSKST